MRLYQRTKASTHDIMQIVGRIMSVTLLSLLLSACFQKSLPVATENTQLAWSKRHQQLTALQNWTVQGKAAFQAPKESGSASFEWQQQAAQFSFAAFNPLGSEVFRIAGSNGSAELQLANQQRFHAPSSDELFVRTFGFAFPLSSLQYWVRGLPNPTLPAQTQFDDSHRLATLQQANWLVEFQSYTTINHVDLPRFIVLTSAPYKAKVIIYQWKMAESP